MSTSFLNPIELLGLADRQDVSNADLRKAKKRFLMELELDGREDFAYYGILYTGHDLDRAIDLLKDDEALVAYQTAAAIPGLAEFLTTERISHFFDVQRLRNPRLRMIMKIFFADAFGRAYRRVLLNGDVATYKELSRWKPESLGLRESALYGPASQLLDGRVSEVVDIAQAYLRAPKSERGKQWRNLHAFFSRFPKEMTAAWPEYLKDISGRLANELLPVVLQLNNEQGKVRMALSLNRALLDLPHLNQGQREELLDISRQLRRNVVSRRAPYSTRPSRGDNSAPWRALWFVFVVAILLFRIGSCVEKESRSKGYAARSGSPAGAYKHVRALLPLLESREKNRLSRELFLRASLNLPLDSITVSPLVALPADLAARLGQPKPDISAANATLHWLGHDTVTHINEVVPEPERELMKLPLADVIRLEKSNEHPTEIDRPKLQRLITARQEELAAAQQARKDAEEEGEAKRRREKTLAKENKGVVRRPTERVLGPRAALPENYSLPQQRSARPNDHLLRVKVGIDDSTVSAIICWRDTFGLRQVRIPVNPITAVSFHVARGQVDHLLDGYIVYGRLWDKEATGPWGGRGWFRETIGYFGPGHHAAFINGKKSYRKNLWLPARKLDPDRSLTPAAFLRAVKRL